MYTTVKYKNTIVIDLNDVSLHTVWATGGYWEAKDGSAGEAKNIGSAGI